MRKVLVLVALGLGASVQACTVLLVARQGEVFAAGNEDESNDAKFSKHYVRFVPAKKETGAMGYVAFGYSKNPFNDESAMNEAGLFYDFTAQDRLEKPREGKPRAKFSTINEMLTRCRTVAEAVQYLEGFDLATMSAAEILIGDATGASVIVERHMTTLRPVDVDFQIATNFRASLVPKDQITCDRYRFCDSKLGQRKNTDATSIAEILEGVAAKAPSSYRTWYSLVCDLKRKRVNLYREGAFTQAFSFSLDAELNKGFRKLDMEEFMGLGKR